MINELPNDYAIKETLTKLKKESDMNIKVIKLEGDIKVVNSEVDKQPTIHVMIGGEVKVTLDDGRIFEDKDLLWCDRPEFKNDSLSDSENEEITNQIKENLWDAARRISNKIKEISIGISGG